MHSLFVCIAGFAIRYHQITHTMQSPYPWHLQQTRDSVQVGQCVRGKGVSHFYPPSRVLETRGSPPQKIRSFFEIRGSPCTGRKTRV